MATLLHFFLYRPQSVYNRCFAFNFFILSVSLQGLQTDHDEDGERVAGDFPQCIPDKEHYSDEEDPVFLLYGKFN